MPLLTQSLTCCYCHGWQHIQSGFLHALILWPAHPHGHKAGQPLAQVSNEDSMRMWQGLMFLPMAGNTIQKGAEATVGNQVRAALKEAYDSGKLNAAYQ